MDNKFLAACFAAYFGSKVNTQDGICEIHAINQLGTHCHSKSRQSRFYGFDETKIILKPLSAISDEDATFISEKIMGFIERYVNLTHAELGKKYVKNREMKIEVIDYLRSKSYDCGFRHIPSLIDAGIAIDATVNNG